MVPLPANAFELAGELQVLALDHVPVTLAETTTSMIGPFANTDPDT